MNAPLSQAAKIAMLNDAFRSTLGLCSIQGQVLFTCGVTALAGHTQEAIFKAVAAFDSFSKDNDPHGEHDFGSIDIDAHRIFWKIDYYADASCEWGSEHPADPTRSYRVLTIMLASEY